MPDPHDRSDRFELIAACDDETLVSHADAVLDGAVEMQILQAPTPQLVMQQVTDLVQRQPFNLGEVVVTAAEVTLNETKGFAMVPGKAEKPALSGALIDAAVADGHPRAAEIVSSLETAGNRETAAANRRWGHARETRVDFEEMEDHT